MPQINREESDSLFEASKTIQVILDLDFGAKNPQKLENPPIETLLLLKISEDLQSKQLQLYFEFQMPNNLDKRQKLEAKLEKINKRKVEVDKQIISILKSELEIFGDNFDCLLILDRQEIIVLVANREDSNCTLCIHNINSQSLMTSLLYDALLTQ